MDKTQLNMLFGATVVILFGLAVYSLWGNMKEPMIVRDSPGVQQAGADLPPNQPPDDAAERLAALEKLSREDPENAVLKREIGNIYYDMGLYQSAIEPYQESLALKPQEPGVETDLATCWHYLGQHDKALEILDRVLSYRPHFPQALFNKGVVLQMGKKNSMAAVKAWEELLRFHPDHPMKAELEQRIRALKSGTN
jgi:tetratricopeptide (TPR) repeat protein